MSSVRTVSKTYSAGDVVRDGRQKVGGDGALLDVYYDEDADTLT